MNLFEAKHFELVENSVPLSAGSLLQRQFTISFWSETFQV